MPRNVMVKEVITHMPDAFRPDRAKGLDATIMLRLTGLEGGKWSLRIKNQTLNIEEGAPADPDLTLTMPAREFVNLTMGDANPMVLFAAGKLKAEGNLALALKFQEIFDKTEV